MSNKKKNIKKEEMRKIQVFLIKKEFNKMFEKIRETLLKGELIKKVWLNFKNEREFQSQIARLMFQVNPWEFIAIRPINEEPKTLEEIIGYEIFKAKMEYDFQEELESFFYHKA